MKTQNTAFYSIFEHKKGTPEFSFKICQHWQFSRKMCWEVSNIQ